MANTDGNPFVGPRPIQQDEPLYGRSLEVRALYNRLVAHRIVVLHSPSGAGKSSLVQAGLIPRLKEGGFEVWKAIRVNLDVHGLGGVPAASNRYLLSAMLSLEEELPPARRRSPTELADLDFANYLATRPRRKGREDRPVVLLFDQFEEVLTVAPRAVADKRAFFTSVGKALDTGVFWALFVIREDYLAAFAPYRELIPTQMANTFRLDLLGVVGAREAAVQLAQAGGRSFPAVDHLIRDLSTVQVQQADGTFVAEQGLYVEPVQLQVVCRQLWEAIPAGDRSIEEEDLAKYADVTQALARYYADAVAKTAGGDPAVERAVREWVGNRLIMGGIRSQVRREVGKSSGLDNALIDRLLGCYLVHTEQRAGADWFELTHDRLVAPVQRDNEAWEQAHLHPLQVQARMWENGRRSQSLLLSAEVLVGATAWATEHPELVTAEEQEFLELSRKLRADEARQRDRQRAYVLTLAVGVVVALVVGAFALYLRSVAVRQMMAYEAQLSRTEGSLAQAREGQRAALWIGYVRTFMAKDPTRALAGLGELSSLEGVPGALQLARGAFARPSALAVLIGHGGPVLAAAFSPDGTRVVTASQDGTARLWHADGRGASVVLTGHRGPVRSASFSRDGTRIVTASDDGSARVWQTDRSGEAVKLMGAKPGGLVSAAFSRDAQRVLTLSALGEVSVWGADGASAPVLLSHPRAMGFAAWSPDGSQVVTTETKGGQAWVWHLDNPGEPVRLGVDGDMRADESTVGATFSQDGRRVLTVEHGRARLWNADGSGDPVVIAREGVVVAGLSADGRRIATLARDSESVHAVQIWDAGTGEAASDRSAHGGWALASLSRDGQGALTFSAKAREVKLWAADASDEQAFVELRGHQDVVTSAAFGADGGRVVTASRDGTARVWDLQRGPDRGDTMDGAVLLARARTTTSLCVPAEERVEYLGATVDAACEAFALCERKHGRSPSAIASGVGGSICVKQ